MNTVTRAVKNTGITFVGSLAIGLINLVVFIYTARYLGAVTFGTFSFILAYIGIFGILTDLGIRTIAVRELSQNTDKSAKIAGNIIIIKFILSLFAILLSVITITLLDYPSSTQKLVYLASLLLLSSSIGTAVGSVFAAQLEMKYTIISSMVSTMLYALLVFIIIILNGTVFYIFLVMILTSFVGLIITLSFSKKFVTPVFDFDVSYSLKLLKSALPIGITGILLSIYFRVDIMMLSFLKGDTAIGYYSVAYRLTEAFGIIPTAFMASAFPLMSKYFKTSLSSLIDLYNKSLKYMLLIGLPIPIFILFLSKGMVGLLFGDEFSPSASAFSILIWGKFFYFLNVVLAGVLVAIEKQAVIAYMSVLFTLMNITLNYLLIPKYSYVGASIATLISKAMGTFIGFYVLHRVFTPKTRWRMVLKIVGINALLLLFTLVFGFMPLVPLALVSAILYLILIKVTHCLTGEELEHVEMIIKRLFSPFIRYIR